MKKNYARIARVAFALLMMAAMLVSDCIPIV